MSVDVMGLIFCNIGALLAFGAQLSMGLWRVGVRKGAVGPLVSVGLYRAIAEIQTFVGQGLLILGVLLTTASVLGAVAFALFACTGKYAG
ncbi:MAG: hypothetical protein U5N55_05885 [Cypionkella sp.]|nr:hypothetical protein [Cypionkella sp.]